ncbi:MAG: DNA-3-methyladenine glycosylase 2 family protein [Sutterellaceae bacterium]|nr:DNA-3-methyladenine glycosylase 2 family protein [Burkholderiaceae bacterium]MCX7902067.1 DNA-3-methyladenine glycosylase 2 family protein [Burkholderiaceae bacterium]MDW8430238.1 DNA-3-methyladenine glycosylase 2 family protein [Sutterellaceae bacterium]
MAVTPAYWSRAKRELASADAVLARIIAQHPRARLVSRGDPFATLARSIVGQQISVKAADAVWTRLIAACPQLQPQELLRRRPSTLRACGLSERKVEYLRDLAQHFVRERIDARSLAAMTDEEVIAQLTAIRGIGRWTAEMFLIFNLLRPNVLPLDDLGLLRAVSLHYLDGAPVADLLRGPGRQRVARLAQAWAPWRSVATWYLWRSLDPVPVAY